MKTTLRKSGDKRVTLRVEHHLNKEELIGALYTDVYFFETLDDLPEVMPEAEIIKHIRKSLLYKGEDSLYPEDKNEEYWEWCTEQIERIVK